MKIIFKIILITQLVFPFISSDVSGNNGLVVSSKIQASEIGINIMKNGGNAIDAAIAASFAVSVVEPWMSGLGGGGYMLVYLAKERRVRVIDFGMVAPKHLDPADYQLVDGEGTGTAKEVFFSSPLIFLPRRRYDWWGG